MEFRPPNTKMDAFFFSVCPPLPVFLFTPSFFPCTWWFAFLLVGIMAAGSTKGMFKFRLDRCDCYLTSSSQVHVDAGENCVYDQNHIGVSRGITKSYGVVLRRISPRFAERCQTTPHRVLLYRITPHLVGLYTT